MIHNMQRETFIQMGKNLIFAYTNLKLMHLANKEECFAFQVYILFSLKQSETTPFATSRLDYPLMEKKRVIGALKMITE